MSGAPISRFLRAGVPLVIVIAVIALLPCPSWAQSAASAQPATVQHVLVREAGEMMEVEIQTSAPVSPNTQVITGPDRIVVDFPGSLPSAQLRALKVNRGTLKGVRSGLFFNDPPITRVVLDLTGPQVYHISNVGNVTVVKFARGAGDEFADEGQKPRLQEAALGSRTAHLSTASVAVTVPSHIAGVQISRTPLENGGASTAMPQAPRTPAPIEAPQPVEPPVKVSYENGLLSIHADKATLSQVLYEVHLRTQADIAIPAGAEQEKVIADLGPAPARDVLSELLNGSAYNFIFVGDELSLQRVILTRREGNF
jgi:hypothetical protein